MKKLFIGLLVVAAGAGTFYFLQKKKTGNDKPVDKELLLGKWKMDSISVSPKDSALASILSITPKGPSVHEYRFDFQKDGAVLQALNDSVKVDTSYYEWNKENELLIKESLKDSTSEVYSVKKLSIDSLVLQSKDSAVYVLTKLK
jgi:hypothetical protein